MATLFKVVVVAILGASVLGVASLEAAGGDMIKQVVGQRAFGLITSVIGAPVLGTVGSATRDLSVGTTVAIADEVSTGQDDTLEILKDLFDNEKGGDKDKHSDGDRDH